MPHLYILPVNVLHCICQFDQQTHTTDYIPVFSIPKMQVLILNEGLQCQSVTSGFKCREHCQSDTYLVEVTINLLLCRLPALAEAAYRDHFCRLASSSSASQKISLTFISGTTQASFVIFGTEHRYGELYRVTQF